jgi:tetratricopeptide (TPR) repeat protein
MMKMERSILPKSKAAFVCALAALFLHSGCASSSPKTEKKASGPPPQERIDPVAYQHFSVGTIAFSDGDYPTAAAHFERALRFDPESYEIRMSLAETYFRMRDLDRAMSIAESTQPRDDKVLDFLGQCYRYAGRDREAIDIYERLIASDSLNPSSYWYLARLLMKQEDFDRGVAYLERAARLRGDSQTFNEVAELYARSGRYEDALTAFKESIALDSSAENRGALIGMAEALGVLGRSDEARISYREAIQLEPGDLMARKRLINHFLYTEQLDSAVAAIQELLEIKPDDPERLRLGMIWYGTSDTVRAESLFTAVEQAEGGYLPTFYLGRIAEDRRDFKTAKSCYRRVIAESDTIPDGWLHLGSVLFEQDSVEAAVDVLTHAAGKVSNPKALWYFLGATFARRQSYDSALVWLDRAYALDSNDTRVQFAVASALERSGRFTESARMFSDLLRKEPDNAPALNYLGYMYADSGVHLEESLKMIERALSFEPDNGAYLDSYGWALYRLGRLEEAEAQIRKALGVVQSDATIHEHLGDILRARGRLDEAREHWQRAYEINPDNHALRTKLD